MNSWPSGKYLLYMYSILQLICIICSLVSHFHSTIYLLFKQLYFNNLHLFLIILVNNNNAGFIAYFMWEITKETIDIWCVWNNHKVQQKHISSIQKVLYTSYLLHYLTCYITKLSSPYWFPPVRGFIVGTFLQDQIIALKSIQKTIFHSEMKMLFVIEHVVLASTSRGPCSLVKAWLIGQ